MNSTHSSPSPVPESLTPYLDTWWEAASVDNEEGMYTPRGLWIYGPRGCGTSFIASRALRRCYGRFTWPFDGERYTETVAADELVSSIKELWQLESGVRSHQHDAALFNEATQAGLQVEWWLRNSPATFLDDLHRDAYDGQFFRQRVWPALEGRIKDGKVLIVASDMKPSDALGEYWPNLFTAIDLVALDVHMKRDAA